MSYSSFRHRLLRLFNKPKTDEDRAEEVEKRLEEVLEEAEEEGLIDVEASEMFLNVLDLDTTRAYEIMVPRTSLTAVPDDIAIPELIHTIHRSGHSRIPVYSGSVDSIVGLVYAKDVLRFWGRPDGDIELKALLREPYFVPESKPLDDLLRDFQARKVQIAIVVDEYGGTSGLVTLEDIFEVIVGDIEDEYDRAGAEALTVQDDGNVKVAANFNIDDFFERFDLEPPEGDFSTVGGWIFERIGRIPRAEEQFTLDGYPVVIDEADERRIRRVSVDVSAATAALAAEGAD
ncbi:MAG: hemolysin family protein [Deltaproteobacteria bacterium]|nr:hemolysin family protein [Deltaproteobacteria bacterium]